MSKCGNRHGEPLYRILNEDKIIKKFESKGLISLAKVMRGEKLPEVKEFYIKGKVEVVGSYSFSMSILEHQASDDMKNFIVPSSSNQMRWSREGWDDTLEVGNIIEIELINKSNRNSPSGYRYTILQGE